MKAVNNPFSITLILKKCKMWSQTLKNDLAGIEKSDILYGLYTVLTTFLCPILIYIIYKRADLLVLSMLSAMFTTRMDSGGHYRARARTMIIGACLFIVSYLLSVWVRGNTVYTVLVVFFWPFLLRMLRVFGRQTIRGSSIAIIGLIIFISQGNGASMEAAHIYTILLSMTCAITIRLIPWSFAPYQPAYDTISNYYRAIYSWFRWECSAILCPGALPDGEAEVRKEFSSIEKARKRSLLLIKDLKGHFNQTTWNMYLVIKKADLLLSVQVALSENLRKVNLAKADPEEIKAVKMVLEIVEIQFSNIFKSMEKKYVIGHDIVTEIAMEELSKKLMSFAQKSRGTTDNSDVHDEILYSLNTLTTYIETLRSTIRLINHPVAKIPKAAPRTSFVSASVKAFRSAIQTLKSQPNIARDAAFFSVFLSLAAGISIAFTIPHGYWISLTTAIILKDNFQETFQKALARVFGTLSGGLIAVLLSALIPNNILILWIIVVFWLIAIINYSRNYGIYVLFWTPVIIFALNMNDIGNLSVAMQRMYNTCAGGALALCAISIYYLTLEKTNIRRQIAAALSANRELMNSIFDLNIGGHDSSDIENLCQKAISECTAASAFFHTRGTTLGGLIFYNRKLCSILTAIKVETFNHQMDRSLTVKLQSMVRRFGDVLEEAERLIRSGGKCKVETARETSIISMQEIDIYHFDQRFFKMYFSELGYFITCIQTICSRCKQNKIIRQL